MMNLIHSIWTKPAIEKRWQINGQLAKNLWLYAYSVMHAKRISDSLILHSDSFGAKTFGELGYDDVKISLDILASEPSRFWSRGKMIALDAEPLGTIHIDGDVFLKSPMMIDVLDFQNYDLIVQCEERIGIFMKHYFDTIHHFPASLNSIPDGFNQDLKHSLNCGVMGFNNQKLKDDYLAGYFSMVDQLKSNPVFMQELQDNPKFEPNIVIEQFFLAGYVDQYNLNYKNVLPLKSDATDELGTVTEMNFIANEIGYAHAWGDTKYYLIPEIQKRIRNQDFRFYNRVLRLEQNTEKWQTEL